MELIRRTTSRKFLLAVGAFITLIANKQYVEATAIVLGFLGVEGALDHKAAS